MSDRSELSTKLTAASDWVRKEFDDITGIATDLGLSARIEGGPGVALLLNDRIVARVHPKLRHIGIGLPDAMREDVAALTNALRSQRGFAWFNYTPDVADQDTVELLIATSRDAASTSPATRTVSAGIALERIPRTGADATARGPTRRRPRDDHADLTLVLRVIEAFRAHSEATALPSALKPLREAIFFQWEGPRLPSGGTRSPQLPHSPAARAQRSAGDHRGLVYEHVLPLSIVIKRLLGDVPQDIESLRAVLDSTSDRVVITKAEDAALTSAGLRDTAPDAGDPWSRYRTLGLVRSDFVPLSE